MALPSIHIDQFDYDLPQDRIAKYPLEYRDESKLLIYNKGEVAHKNFYQLPDIVPSGSALVFNNSRVISARLRFQKETGAQIEIFCLEPIAPSSYEQNLQNTETVTWKCLVGNKKKWKTGELKTVLNIKGNNLTLTAQYSDRKQTEPFITFIWNNPNINFGDILDAAGTIPIPPYLLREAEELDKTRYQTIYSRIKGSVAAPTAGLHFTPRVIEQLENMGNTWSEMTLHVGAGTFKPVQANDVSDHVMHEEYFTVSLKQLEFIKENLGKIIAVGTTSTRLMESLYQMGIKCIKGDFNGMTHIQQWDPYKIGFDIEAKEAIEALIDYFSKNKIEKTTAKTSIIIVPGYQFKIINALITNFHQPRSTLLLLISAFIGDDWKKVYRYAMNNDFRFLSYGDSSILFPV